MSFCLKTSSFVFSTLQNYELIPPLQSFFVIFIPTYNDNWQIWRQLILTPLKICRLEDKIRTLLLYCFYFQCHNSLPFFSLNC